MTLCEQIKARVSLRGMAALVGIALPERDCVKFRSPFRPDRSPSCTVKGDLYSDWSSGEHLDQIDLFAKAKSIQRRDAIHDLSSILQIVGDIRKQPQIVPAQIAKPELTKAQKRAAWPAFLPPSRQELRQIAELRGISIEGVTIAADRGLLFSIFDRNAHAWAVTDSARLNARIRRIDRELWYGREKTMPPTGGGQESSWPVGAREAQPFPAISIVEGEGEMLAALHLAWCAGIENLVTVVGMLGAANQISETALPLFAGKRVRIFEDNDDSGAGQRAATRWAQQLSAAGATVDRFSFEGLVRADGFPVKDMTDFAHICPNQWASAQARIESAFSFAFDPKL